MARATASDWDKAKDMFEIGKSLTEISDETGIDRATISKRSKKDNWEKAKFQQLITDTVRVRKQISTLSSTLQQSVENEISDRLRHEQFFTNAAIRNVQESLQVPCESQQDFKYRAETIQKGRETVLGKSPDSAVQINNNNNNGPMTLADFYGNSDNTNA